MTTIFEPVSQCDVGESTPKILPRFSNSGHLCLGQPKITQFVQALNNQSTNLKREQSIECCGLPEESGMSKHTGGSILYSAPAQVWLMRQVWFSVIWIPSCHHMCSLHAWSLFYIPMPWLVCIWDTAWNGSPNFPLSEVVIKVGWGWSSVCVQGSAGGFTPVKERCDHLQVTLKERNHGELERQPADCVCGQRTGGLKVAIVFYCHELAENRCMKTNQNQP